MLKKKYNKNIIALEANWENFSAQDDTGMRPLLEFITKNHRTKYSYKFVNTTEELNYTLENIYPKEFGMVYLAFHGKPNNIMLGTYQETDVSLDDLAKVMGNKFEGFAIHFASCAVLNIDENSLTDFKNKTGASFVSGYKKYIDFFESSLMDMALINRWMYARNYKRMFEKMKKSYKSLMTENGFKYVI